MSSDVQCMALGTVPTGEQRSRFLAIGLSDNTVRVISLDPQDCLQPLSMQALPATPESLCIVEMAMGGLESESGRLGGLFLNIGLSVCCWCFMSQVFVWPIIGPALLECDIVEFLQLKKILVHKFFSYAPDVTHKILPRK